MFTNTLGAALWAVDIEQQEKAVTENVAAATTTATDTNSVNQQGLVIPVHNEPATNIPEATPKLLQIPSNTYQKVFLVSFTFACNRILCINLI